MSASSTDSASARPPSAQAASGTGQVDEVAPGVAHRADAVGAALAAQAAEALPPVEGAAGAGGEPVEVALGEALPAECVVGAHQVPPPSGGRRVPRAPGAGVRRGSVGPPGSGTVVGLRSSTSACTARLIGDDAPKVASLRSAVRSRTSSCARAWASRMACGDRAPAVPGGVVAHREGDERPVEVDLHRDTPAQGAASAAHGEDLVLPRRRAGGPLVGASAASSTERRASSGVR